MFIVTFGLSVIAILILSSALFFLIKDASFHNKLKIVFSCLAVIFIFCLAFSSGFSLLKLIKKQQNFNLIRPEISSIRDLSDLDSEKYMVNVVVPQGLNKSQIKVAASKINSLVKQKNAKASIVWIAFFSKDLPKEEMVAKTSNPYFICQTQWVAENYAGFLSSSFKPQERFKDIDLYWKK